jgi:hypothetical protein
MFEDVKLALLVGAGAAVVAAVCLGYVVSQNLGSRNVGLASAALAGAILLFVVQLFFELKPSAFADTVSAEFTINRGAPRIHHWNYEGFPSRRMTSELAASDFFFKTQPGQFNDDRGILTRDFIVFSLVAYLASEHFDWQAQRVQFVGPNSGTFTRTAYVSKPNECVAVMSDQLTELLRNAGNKFSGASIFFFGDRLCLPPRTSIEILPDALTLTNPFCTISIALEESGGVNFAQPKTHGEVPQLPDGEAALEIRSGHNA